MTVARLHGHVSQEGSLGDSGRVVLLDTGRGGKFKMYFGSRTI